VGQEKAGTGDGSSYVNRMSLSRHNAVTSPEEKKMLLKTGVSSGISQGDTVFLCGDMTSQLNVSSSGSEGSPIIYSGDCPGDEGSINIDGPDGIRIENRSFIEVGHLTVFKTGGASMGVKIINSRNIRIHHCDINVAGTSWTCGIEVQGGPGGQHSTGIYLHDNKVTAINATAQDGIYLFNGVQDFHIYRNTVTDFNHSNLNFWDKTTEWNSGNGEIWENDISSPNRGYTHGIDLKGTAGRGFRDIKVYRNYIHDLRANNQIAAENIEFYNNVIARINNCCNSLDGGCPEIYDNCSTKGYYGVGHGVTLESGWSNTSCKNVKIFNNIFYRTQETAIFLGKAGSGHEGHQVYNNIILECEYNSTAEANFVQHPVVLASFSNLEVRNNIIYNPGRSATVGYLGSSLDVDALNSESSSFSGNMDADPELNDPQNSEFWPGNSGSPVVDAGFDLGDDYLAALMNHSQWPDKVTAGNQNDFGAGWEIGPYIHGNWINVKGPQNKDGRPFLIDNNYTLRVYNLYGKLVQTLVNTSHKAGMHYVNWDREKHPAGFYFFKLTDDKNSIIKKSIP
jgi:hypothetical protein